MQRASLGDPDFLENVPLYEAGMLNESSATRRRGKISDSHTLNISDYDPSGFESLETSVQYLMSYTLKAPNEFLGMGHLTW